MTTHIYETDIVAWANEQTHLVRTGQFELLDLKYIAEEIEDVGKIEDMLSDGWMPTSPN